MSFDPQVQIFQFLNIDSLRQSVVVVLQLFFPFLNEFFLRATDELLMREVRKLIFVLGGSTPIMNLPHLAVPRLKDNGLLLLALWVDLDGVPHCSIIVDGFGEFEEIFWLWLHPLLLDYLLARL